MSRTMHRRRKALWKRYETLNGYTKNISTANKMIL